MRERSTVDEGTSGKFAKPPATESLESLLKTQIPIIASGSRIRESAFFFFFNNQSHVIVTVVT